MKNSGGLRGLFIAIGVIDFVVGIFLFTALLSGYDSKYYIYEYYGLFVVIGIGVINAILSMVIPAIKGGKKAVPGLVFSIIGSALCLFSITIGEANLDRYKEAQEQKKQQDQEQKKQEEETRQTWLTTAGLDELTSSDLAELAERYESRKEKYENMYSIFSQEDIMLIDGTDTFTSVGGEYRIQKQLADDRCTTEAKKYTGGGDPIILDHSYQEFSQDGYIETKHSYFGYGTFGYLHVVEKVNTKAPSYTTTSQTFIFTNEDGFISKIGFVETVVLTSNPNDYYKCQLVYSVVYHESPNYNYNTDYYGVM